MPLVDFAIVTGLTEEFEVVRSILPSLTEISDDSAIETWYRTEIQSSNGRSYHVVASFQNDMGVLEAQLLTKRLIDRWDPAYIVLVGIAGSLHPDVKLGDVIVSQQVFYYDPGKAVPSGIKYRPQGYPCSPALVRQTEALRLDPPAFARWRQSADKSFKKLIGRSGSHKPDIHFGTVASGSLVIADKAKQQELLNLHKKILGIEMEGAGVLHATYYQEMPTPAIVIKGISDTADVNKEELDAKVHWRQLAKENPVRLIIELIQRGRFRPLHTNQFSLNPTLGSVDQAREIIRDVAALGASYQSFPQLVVLKGPATEIRVTIDCLGSHHPISVIKWGLRFTDYQGKEQTYLTDGVEKSIYVTKPISASPVGVYTLLSGTPKKITFSVATPSYQDVAEWTPT